MDRLEAGVALSSMESQMRRDASKQVTSHTNKWLGKQRKAGRTAAVGGRAPHTDTDINRG